MDMSAKIFYFYFMSTWFIIISGLDFKYLIHQSVYDTVTCTYFLKSNMKMTIYFSTKNHLINNNMISLDWPKTFKFIIIWQIHHHIIQDLKELRGPTFRPLRGRNVSALFFLAFFHSKHKKKRNFYRLKWFF